MGLLKSNIVVGVSAALAVTVLMPVLAPVVAAVGRPLAKSLLKGGLMLYEIGREAVATAGESVEDMVAEIHSEDAMREAGSTVKASQPRQDAAPGPVAETHGAQVAEAPR